MHYQLTATLQYWYPSGKPSLFGIGTTDGAATRLSLLENRRPLCGFPDTHRYLRIYLEHLMHCLSPRPVREPIMGVVG